jgi:NADH-quinone oxidoreductase subunit E
MALNFSQAAQDEIAALRPKYPTNLALCLPALHIAQKEFGFVGDDTIHLVAKTIGVAPSYVQEVASFYSLYNRKPVGDYIIQVCQTLSCHLRGAPGVLHYLEKRLGIHVGETTSDGRFSLQTVECLASCGTAPMFQVTARDYSLNAYYENLTNEKIDQILNELSKRPIAVKNADQQPLTSHVKGGHIHG